ncbi:MAG: aminotransferase class III-fold pyridoxal phosphate-dependent enzyme [Bacteroidia bacterium]|nr:aminotransferase class III-fold pyridoxal phosphate-dependent enzyme [Bacteroidia bacterium]
MPKAPIYLNLNINDFTPSAIEKIAHQYFGIKVKSTELISYADKNFYLKEIKGNKYILKFEKGEGRKPQIAFQNEVLLFLQSKPLRMNFPRVYPNLLGEEISEIQDSKGEVYYMRLLSWASGKIWEKICPQTLALCREMGEYLGEMSLALQDFRPSVSPSGNQQWDAVHAMWTQESLHYFQNEEDRDMITRFLIYYKENVLPHLDTLRDGIIHNDANTYNIIVNTEKGKPRVSALIDFGDIAESKIVVELAVCCAYIAMYFPRPLEAAAEIVSGFHSVFPLSETEFKAIFPMMINRVIISLTFSAMHHHNGLEDEYLYISEKPGREMLKKFSSVSPDFAAMYFRNACGLEPYPESSKITQWLTQNAGNFNPIIQPDLRTANSIVLDLSFGSTFLGNFPDFEEVKPFSEKVSRWIQQQKADLAIGKYNEHRPIYTSNIFECEGNMGVEKRTLHIGADVFVPAGTTVFAPLDGEIYGYADNEGDKDYGPTIILRHTVKGESGEVLTFYTLYGHLSRESLEFLERGMKIPKGFAVGQVGNYPENGNWPPHLHFQIITHMLGNTYEFPGVALPSESSVWLNLCPDPNLILQIPQNINGDLTQKRAHLLSIRKNHLARNLSLSYQSPLYIERGFMQYLYDDRGRAYLDTVNNVNHTGHQNPRVVEAAKAQLSVLNTNTRYLYPVIGALTEKLLSKFPEPLQVCFFVNSGSEANELALRLARNYTQGNEMLVMEQGYHGNTHGCIEISSYKFDGKGGKGAPPHVHVLPAPDTYRGIYRNDTPFSGKLYARFADTAIKSIKARKNQKLAGFICESVLSCAGQIVLPDGYLEAVYQKVRSAGGVCIADEVQTGMGRVGSHFWGFELQNVIPDIVTIGKPFGNGHPVAAVVTTRKIADAFANGMEYFNTFGGNPVSCAIALEVLKVIEDEKLQENALEVGNYLKSRLHSLKTQHPCIGDVRGEGLFLGIELIQNLKTLKPSETIASYIAGQMKERGILMSTDGPFHNVLKIKPPLVFTRENAGFLVDTLHQVLSHDFIKEAMEG